MVIHTVHTKSIPPESTESQPVRTVHFTCTAVCLSDFRKTIFLCWKWLLIERERKRWTVRSICQSYHMAKDWVRVVLCVSPCPVIAQRYAFSHNTQTHRYALLRYVTKVPPHTIHHVCKCAHVCGALRELVTQTSGCGAHAQTQQRVHSVRSGHRYVVLSSFPNPKSEKYCVYKYICL